MLAILTDNGAIIYYYIASKQVFFFICHLTKAWSLSRIMFLIFTTDRYLLNNLSIK